MLSENSFTFLYCVIFLLAFHRVFSAFLFLIHYLNYRLFSLTLSLILNVSFNNIFLFIAKNKKRVRKAMLCCLVWTISVYIFFLYFYFTFSPPSSSSSYLSIHPRVQSRLVTLPWNYWEYLIDKKFTYFELSTYMYRSRSVILHSTLFSLSILFPFSVI